MNPADNATMRAAWLAAAGIISPEYLVDFETGFVADQDVSGVTGLCPAGMLITDTSTAHQAIIRTGAGVIGGSSPIGIFAVTRNEAAFLELDFSASPVDYLAFMDIDQAGTSGLAFFEELTSFALTLDSAGAPEFFGIFRNDGPRITRIRMDASGGRPVGDRQHRIRTGSPDDPRRWFRAGSSRT